MSCMRYMLTIEVPVFHPQQNFRYQKKLKTKFQDYDGFVEEIKNMIESGELRRMVEGMTNYHGGAESMSKAYNDSYIAFAEESK